MPGPCSTRTFNTTHASKLPSKKTSKYTKIISVFSVRKKFSYTVIVTCTVIHLRCLQSLHQNLDTIRRNFAEMPLTNLPLVEVIVEGKRF